MLQKNVKSLLEQFQVCIFAEIVFGVRCTLTIFSGSHLAPKYFKVVANSKKLVVIMTHT